MKALLGMVADRLKEPSTYAGLSLVAGMVGVNLDPGIIHTVTIAGTAIAAALAVVVPELKS